MAPRLEGSASIGSFLAEAEVIDLGCAAQIRTGIAFLDHMIDQLTSHAQLAVSLSVTRDSASASPSAPSKRSRTEEEESARDREVFLSAGGALGSALRMLVASLPPCAPQSPTVFCCPLDEAFTEARIDLSPPPERAGHCTLDLTPYGTFASPKAGGRQRVGAYRTELTPCFWESLACAMGIELSLVKVRGANAHHILEATFKSFARALRAAMDARVSGKPQGCLQWEPTQVTAKPACMGEPRRAERKRATKETNIEARLLLRACQQIRSDPSSELGVERFDDG